MCYGMALINEPAECCHYKMEKILLSLIAKVGRQQLARYHRQTGYHSGDIFTRVDHHLVEQEVSYSVLHC